MSPKIGFVAQQVIQYFGTFESAEGSPLELAMSTQPDRLVVEIQIQMWRLRKQRHEKGWSALQNPSGRGEVQVAESWSACMMPELSSS